MRLICFGGFSFGKIWKNMENGRFSRRVQPDWENTAQAELGSIGICFDTMVILDSKSHFI